MDGRGSHSSGPSAAKTPRMHRCHCSLRLQLRVTEEADRDRREEGQCSCRRARARCWEEQSSSLFCPDCCICQPQQLFCPLKDRTQKKTSV